MEKSMEKKGKIGKYTIVRYIGQGGEGCVYLAKDEDLKREVAVKQVRGQKEDSVVQEAEILRQLRHPMLPVIYDLLWDEAWYMVMEYIPGVTLQEYIEKNKYVGEEQARAWTDQLLDILCYLHTRKPPVIYRDLKPQNVMVCTDGNLRLIDFGAAYCRNFGKYVDRMAVTLGYGAPEQFGGKGQEICADERSDLYAFGKLLYYMVTGADPAKPPYAMLPIQDYQPLLGETIEQVIRRCIKASPAERYQMAEEVRKDMNQCERRQNPLHRKSFIRGVEKSVWLTEMKQRILVKQ